METLQLEFKVRPVNTSLYIKAPDGNTDILAASFRQT
jgi:hypothetical protein